MVATKRTYYKALVLMVVFSLNTVVSFACSLSDLFHNFHHHHSAAKIEDHHGGHNHSHGKMHHHSHEKAGSHDHGNNPLEKPDQNTTHSKDDCCSNSVVQMQQVEKAISRIIDAPTVDFVESLSASYYHLSFNTPQQETKIPGNIRWRYPTTIQDLRIVIQSFQI